MRRALCLASLILAGMAAVSGQALTVLHIRVVVADADGTPVPVPRHALLISDNPASAPPRRVVTGLDGTVDVKLRPGNYTVESDRPTAFRGKAYQWTQMLDVGPGAETTLELTAANADADAAPITAADAPQSDPSFLLPRWQDSVVAIWTPTARASGFLVDARGVIATSQRTVGTAQAVEVQLGAESKVAGRVLTADPERDVALIRIDPSVMAAATPAPLACADTTRSRIGVDQELFAIGAPMREPKSMTSAVVERGSSRSLVADFRLASGSFGGPVFTADGVLAGMTSIADGKDERRSDLSRIVPIESVCSVLAAAAGMLDTNVPTAARLPIEPSRPFPVALLESEAARRAGSLKARQIASSDFDVAFLTPVLVYAAQTNRNQARTFTPGPLSDFGNWSEYVEDVPPVLMIRVTPRLVEGFWTTVARGAARTQGVSLPPIKRFRSGFSRMRVLCGDAEVTPIHPFTLEQRITDTDAIHEGLYVFAPDAIGPHCGAVKVELYSEKEPDKKDVRDVDPAIVQDIWQQFEPYRRPPGL